MHRKLAIPLLIIALCLSGCSAQSVATRSEDVITAVINVAAAEVAVVPVQDQAAYSGFVNAAKTLDNQLAVCVGGLGSMSKPAPFAACFNAFAQGLLSPAELSQLRILSPATQAKVQLYVTGILAGVNVVLALVNSSVPPPAIGAPASAAELQQLRTQIGY
jgi:hypothetical protein